MLVQQRVFQVELGCVRLGAVNARQTVEQSTVAAKYSSQNLYMQYCFVSVQLVLIQAVLPMHACCRLARPSGGQAPSTRCVADPLSLALPQHACDLHSAGAEPGLSSNTVAYTLQHCCATLTESFYVIQLLWAAAVTPD